MKLRRLCKSQGSQLEGDCEAMYIADDPTFMVSQGKRLDAATAGELRDVALDEDGHLIPTETVVRAVALLLAEHGHTAMLAGVDEFLAELGPSR